MCHNHTSQKQYKCTVLWRETFLSNTVPLSSFLSHAQNPLCRYKFLCSPVMNEIGELILALTTFPLFPSFAKWMLSCTILSQELSPPNTYMIWAKEAFSSFCEARKDILPAGLKRWLMTWNSYHANKGYVSLTVFLISSESKPEYLSQFTQLLAEVQIWAVLTLISLLCIIRCSKFITYTWA